MVSVLQQSSYLNYGRNSDFEEKNLYAYPERERDAGMQNWQGLQDMASRYTGESERGGEVNFDAGLTEFGVGSQGIQGHGKWHDNPSMDGT